jgi:post-segregation antitoxin (ccd killing protein)
MIVHLNITLDKQLYSRLKSRAPAKKMSAFIAEAIAAKLGPDEKTLDAAYREAAREPWRQTLSDEWAMTDGEAWPE